MNNYIGALKSKMTNEVDNLYGDNYMADPLFVYQPIRRCDNKIYFYADIDQYSQLVLIQLLSDAQNEIISKHAMEIINNTCSEHIELHINSCGGSVTAGLALYDFIKKMNVAVECIVDGVAASAASLILLAADYRDMYPNATVLLHQLSCYGVEGTYNQLKDLGSNIEKTMDKLRKIYLKETSIGFTDEDKAKLEELDTPNEEDIKEYNKYIEDTLDSRLNYLNALLSHDLELDRSECIKFGIIPSDENPFEFDENDQEKIQEFVTSMLNEKVEKSKSKRKSTSTSKTTKTKAKTTKTGRNKKN